MNTFKTQIWTWMRTEGGNICDSCCSYHARETAVSCTGRAFFLSSSPALYKHCTLSGSTKQVDMSGAARYDFTGRAGRERKSHKMTHALFAHRDTSSARPGKGETQEDFIKRLTHLKLQDKNIKDIENLEDVEKLQVLYLQDNKVTSMAPLGTCSSLINLHLSRNNIRVIEGLHAAKNLKKLFLDGNELTHIAGLEMNPQLEELNLNNQRMPAGASLTFDEGCLEVWGGNLAKLSVDGNNIMSLVPFQKCTELSSLSCRDNAIQKVEEVVELAASLRDMSTLDLRGNRVCRVPKYRETVLINCSASLQTLDSKDIDGKQRDALIRFAQHRQQRSRKPLGTRQQEQQQM